MKHLSLLLLVTLVGCRVPVQHPQAVVPAVTVPTTPTYTYWYSAQQRAALDELVGIDGGVKIQTTYSVTVSGKPVEYTECNAGASPIGRFTDYVKVAKVSGQPCQGW